MLLIAARYYELPQWNNNLKSLGSNIVPVQVRSAALKAQTLKCSPFVRQCGIIEIYQNEV